MFKKLLLLIPVTALLVLSFQVVNADYYDRYRSEGHYRTERPIEEDLDIKKLRRYCVRDYCYVIYEICEENGRCVEEAKRIRKEDVDDYEYNLKRTYWNNWTRERTYKYFRENYHYTKRNFEYVYRGSHYGRYNNRYWDF